MYLQYRFSPFILLADDYADEHHQHAPTKNNVLFPRTLANARRGSGTGGGESANSATGRTAARSAA